MKTFREIVLSDSENTAKKQIAKRNPKPFTFCFSLSLTLCYSCSTPFVVRLIEKKGFSRCLFNFFLIDFNNIKNAAP